ELDAAGGARAARERNELVVQPLAYVAVAGIGGERMELGRVPLHVVELGLAVCVDRALVTVGSYRAVGRGPVRVRGGLDRVWLLLEVVDPALAGHPDPGLACPRAA